jgi:hypothetical protein
MTSQYRHRRSSNPATVFANPIEPGEIAVNTANRQIAVGDAAAGTTGAPITLLAVRFFDARAIYAVSDLVVQGGNLYRAKVANGPGSFTAANWDTIAGVSLASDAVPLVDGTAAAGVSALYARGDHRHPSDTSKADKSYADTKVAKAGDNMTGSLAIAFTSPVLTLDQQTNGGGNGSFVFGRMTGNARWSMAFSGVNNETGSNAGSDFTIYRYTDAGAPNGIPFQINRANGLVSANYGVSVTGALNVSSAGVGATAADIRGQSARLLVGYGATSLTYYDADTHNFRNFAGTGLLTLQANASGGAKFVTDVAIADGAAQAVLYFTAPANNKFLYWQGGKFQFYGGNLWVNGSNFVVGKNGDDGTATGLTNVAGFAAGAVHWMAENPYGGNIHRMDAVGGQVLGLNHAMQYSGSIRVNGTTCSFNTSSDGRLKEDLKSFDAGNIVDDTEIYDFKWKESDERAYGVIAQQAVQVYPTQFAYEEKPDRWVVDYSKYVPVLLQELKALRSRVLQLEGGKPIIDEKPTR